MKRHVIVDVETTGMSTKNGGRVIEIGAVAVEGGEIVAELTSLVNTETPIHWGAQRVHGISAAMLRGKPAPEDVWPSFIEFFADSPMVAHNAPFDSGFVRHELSLIGLFLPNTWHCTVRLARKRLPHLPNHRLETVARHLLGDIPADCRLHRALDDARITAQVWLALAT
ncbi:DNA polymerase III PolC-type [Geobacter sp. OR-1]|uniref:3'-5' exonuclease n=1 Tax=Geobacter sp. OR-1 TaxID=1266765 RepID=UPI000542E0A2|nr:3'-5' exonuclease [Geobacter sp. OR-1]GAM08783.1 DNA polymerase III PolC-type [Geobacter sp. OR-1]